MIPTLANAASVIAGALIGMIFNNVFNEKIKTAIMEAIGLAIVYLAIKGCALSNGNTMIIIFSLVLGAVIGTLFSLDDKVMKLARKLEEKFSKDKTSSNFAVGFTQASTIFCVGAMAVVGSVQAGLRLGGETIYAKCILDFVVAIILAGNFGVGVMFSALFVFCFQGLIVLCASLIGPYLSEMAITQMNFVGSVLLIGVGTNMLKITKIKMMNLLPAIFLALILCAFL